MIYKKYKLRPISEFNKEISKVTEDHMLPDWTFDTYLRVKYGDKYQVKQNEDYIWSFFTRKGIIQPNSVINKTLLFCAHNDRYKGLVPGCCVETQPAVYVFPKSDLESVEKAFCIKKRKKISCEGKKRLTDQLKINIKSSNRRV